LTNAGLASLANQTAKIQNIFKKTSLSKLIAIFSIYAQMKFMGVISKHF